MFLTKITNICNEPGVGAFYHSADYIPHSHTLPFEPYIGDIQLKLDESVYIDEEQFTRLLPYLIELKEARIISFQAPEKDVVGKVEEVKELVEEKNLTLEDVGNTTIRDLVEEVKVEDSLQLINERLGISSEPQEVAEAFSDATKHFEAPKKEETTVEFVKEKKLTDPETSPLYTDTVYKNKISNFKKKKK